MIREPSLETVPNLSPGNASEPRARGVPAATGSSARGVGLAGNALLSTAKITVIGIRRRVPPSLIADGYHSLADVLSDIGILLLALKAANDAAGRESPLRPPQLRDARARSWLPGFMLLTRPVMIGGSAVLAI